LTRRLNEMVRGRRLQATVDSVVFNGTHRASSDHRPAASGDRGFPGSKLPGGRSRRRLSAFGSGVGR
jgi:hypothetical protein